MTYTGEVSPGGPADVRALPPPTNTKVAGDAKMSNKSDQRRCREQDLCQRPADAARRPGHQNPLAGQPSRRRPRVAAELGATQDDLGRVRGLSAGWRTNDIGGRLVVALEAAKPLDPSELPERDPKRPGLTKDAALVSDLLKLLLKIRSKETGVAAKLIARSDDLEALAAGVRKGLNMLSGWRYEEFGKDALDLVEGRLAFAIENGKLKMSRRAGGDRRCLRDCWCWRRSRSLPVPSRPRAWSASTRSRRGRNARNRPF